MRASVLAWLAAAWLVTGPAPAAAQRGGQAISWSDDWARFRDWEYVTMPVSFAPALLRLAPHRGTSWTSGVLGDEWVRDRLSLPNGAARQLALHGGDVLIYSLALYPLLDAAIVAWGLDSPDAGGQMALIALEGLGASAAIYFITQALFSRHRPFDVECANDPDFDDDCWTTTRYQSFPSGHVAIAVAGASISCLQHLGLRYYGRPWDAVACGTAIGLAVVSGASRLFATVHWLSDVVVGALIGVAGGYLIPAALHYGFGAT